MDQDNNLLAGRRRYQALTELYGLEYQVECHVIPVKVHTAAMWVAFSGENRKAFFPLGSKSAEDRVADWDMGGERRETSKTFLPNMLRFPYSCLLCADDNHHSFLDEEDKRCQQEGA